MELNLHGFELVDAIVEVIQCLEECKQSHDSSIAIIHGYQHGTILKNYFRSSKFISDMKKNGFVLQAIKISNQGQSIFRII